MTEITPAINEKTWEKVVEKIRLVEPFAKWVHLDIADGTFAPNTTWHNPLDLVKFETNCNVEVHLMQNQPEERVPAWLLKPVNRIIVHYEVTHDFDLIAKECRDEGIQAGLAIGPHTSWSCLKPFVKKADLLQVLAVHPGLAGQQFEWHNLVKIKHLRAFCPSCTIEVDGGVNPPVAHECIQAGANILASASYIFNHPSQKLAVKELQSMPTE